MLTPPADLDPRDLVAAVAVGWAFEATGVEHVPLGFGSHHWVVTSADGEQRFVTVDDVGAGGPAHLVAALRTARALADAGLPWVVAPLPALTGELVVPVAGRYAAAVYPYLTLASLDGDDTEQVVALLAELHAAPGAARAAARWDDLAVQGRAGLERVLGRLGEPWRTGPFAEPAREALVEHAEDLAVLLGAYDAAAQEVGAHRSGWVVTHGEPKPGNLMRHGGRVVLLDWDTALLAPAARDVWMLEDWGAGPVPGSGVGDGAAVRRYAEVTGRGIPQRELTLFRLRWDLTDIALFAADLAAPHERTADTDVAWGALAAGLGGLPRWRRALAG